MFGLDFGVLLLAVVAIAFLYAIASLVWTIVKVIVDAVVAVIVRFVCAFAGLSIGACVLYTIISMIS